MNEAHPAPSHRAASKRDSFLVGAALSRRTALVIASCAALTACAPREFKPLEFAPPVPLQDPLPGHAIVYLLRIPRDGSVVDVSLNGVSVARLPAATYTAVSLAPGTYSIDTTEESSRSASVSGEKPLLTVASGERRFLYSLVPTKTTDSIQITSLGKVGFFPLFLPVTTRIGERTWHECNELDAQGLMSNGRVVLPLQQQLP